MEEKEKIYKAVFGDNAQCYHHPELKQLVFLCMDEIVKMHNNKDNVNEPKSFEKSFEWAWSKIAGQQWTSVKEAVPNNERNLLVLTNEDGPMFYHVAQYFDGTWATHSEILHYVTHWMELPPLPAGGGFKDKKPSTKRKLKTLNVEAKN